MSLFLICIFVFILVDDALGAWLSLNVVIFALEKMCGFFKAEDESTSRGRFECASTRNLGAI